MTNINLLAETMHDIVDAHKRTDDVKCVRSYDGEYSISWQEFAKISDKLYNNGYGAAEVATDLIVEFEDGTYLERVEYDGAEGWRYVPTLRPIQPDAKTFTKVISGLWPTVAELNNPNEWDENDR